MIAFIKGLVDSVYDGGVVLDCHNIGFDIKMPGSALGQLPGVGEEVKLHTCLYVREDIMDLYGFLSREDRYVFQLLIGISGIGPKAALAILSTLTVEQLRYAVLSDDDRTIARAPGIGPKGARRLIMELKDKLKLEDSVPGVLPAGGDPSEDIVGNTMNEAVLALVSLGYSNSDAMRAVHGVPNGDRMTTEQLLKEALKKIMTF